MKRIKNGLQNTAVNNSIVSFGSGCSVHISPFAISLIVIRSNSFSENNSRNALRIASFIRRIRRSYYRSAFVEEVTITIQYFLIIFYCILSLECAILFPMSLIFKTSSIGECLNLTPQTRHSLPAMCSPTGLFSLPISPMLVPFSSCVT